MDLQPLRDFIVRYELETEPAFSALEVASHAGQLADVMLRDTRYGRRAATLEGEARERMQAQIGNLMFAIAYLSTLYDVDPETALWESVRRFEEKLNSTKDKL